MAYTLGQEKTMKNEIQADWDRLLVKASGVALLTVALTWLPQALSALSILVCHSTIPGQEGGGEVGDMLRTYKMQMISSAIGQFTAFAVLVGIARWILSYPKVIRRWLKSADSTANETISQQAGSPNGG
jgi:hypothetical protein